MNSIKQPKFLYPQRAVDSHKGDYGRLLILAGSPGLTGAAHMAGVAALRSGAGLVTLGVPQRVSDILEAMSAPVMTKALPDTKEGVLSRFAADEIVRFSAQCDAICFGPGVGRMATTSDLLQMLIAQVQLPMVIDADGLYLLGDGAHVLRAARRVPTVLTPHEGEAARLLGWARQRVHENRAQAAEELQQKTGTIVILKGSKTLVTDGRTIYENNTGNPGMATAGAGDVLSGILTALLGRGFDAFDACCFAVYLHGVAGDCAAESKGQEAMIATDLIDVLPTAISRAQRTLSC